MQEEDDILRKYYPIEGPDVYKRLPGRTETSCRNRAKYLDIIKAYCRWSAEEDGILCQYYPIEGPDVYKRLPGRTSESCKARAFKIGIKTTR